MIEYNNRRNARLLLVSRTVTCAGITSQSPMLTVSLSRPVTVSCHWRWNTAAKCLRVTGFHRHTLLSCDIEKTHFQSHDNKTLYDCLHCQHVSVTLGWRHDVAMERRSRLAVKISTTAYRLPYRAWTVGDVYTHWSLSACHSVYRISESLVNLPSVCALNVVCWPWVTGLGWVGSHFPEWFLLVGLWRAVLVVNDSLAVIWQSSSCSNTA